jgi:hypothetical protein
VSETSVTFQNKEKTLTLSLIAGLDYITISGADGQSTHVLVEDIEDLIDYVRHAEGWVENG